MKRKEYTLSACNVPCSAVVGPDLLMQLVPLSPILPSHTRFIYLIFEYLSKSEQYMIGLVLYFV